MPKQLPKLLKGKKASEAFMEYVEPFLETLLKDRVEKGVLKQPTLKEIESILGSSAESVGHWRFQ